MASKSHQIYEKAVSYKTQSFFVFNNSREECQIVAVDRF